MAMLLDLGRCFGVGYENAVNASGTDSSTCQWCRSYNDAEMPVRLPASLSALLSIYHSAYHSYWYMHRRPYPCLSYHHTPLPPFSSSAPLSSFIMTSSRSHVRSVLQECLQALVHHLGGEFHRNFTASVTHLVVASTKSDKYRAAITLNTPVVTMTWAPSCLAKVGRSCMQLGSDERMRGDELIG